MKIISFLICLLLIINCNKESKEILKADPQTGDMKLPVLPNEKHIIYGINTSIQNNFDLLINDMPAIINSIGYSTFEVNPYILKNGIYKVKMRFYIKNVDPEILKRSKVNLVTYLKDENGEYIENSKKEIKQLTINYPENLNVDFFDQEWEIEVKDIPYDVEGWSNGQDLNKTDKEELLSKVTAFYEMIWKTLNDGDGKKWSELTKKRQFETAIFDYNSSAELARFVNENEETVNQKCKNMMTPLEDYELKIYGHGKIVTLERKSNTTEFNGKKPLDIKGWSPLIRKYESSGGSDFPILLYLPKNSDEFVIIRK